MRKAAELIVEEAKPVAAPAEEPKAAGGADSGEGEKLWTPEGEGQSEADAGDLWTPGDDDKD